MKKYLVLIVVMLFLVTGCKKSLTCTLKTEDDGYNTHVKIKYSSSKNGIIDSASSTSTMTFDSEETAKGWFNVLNSINDSNEGIKQEKNKIIITNIQDYSNSSEKLEEVKKQMESNGYSCK